MKRPATTSLILKGAHRYNRAALFLLRQWRGPRLEVGDNCDLWAGCMRLWGGGKAVFENGAVVERGPFPLIVEAEKGGIARFGEGTWVRGKYGPNVVTCFEDALVAIGKGSFLNGAVISARERVEIGERAMLSWGVSIMDSDLHDIDNDTPMRARPVVIGDHVLIGAGALVLPGSAVGSHSVIGAGSVVKGEVPERSLAFGNPARVSRRIGLRDLAR